MITFFCVKLKLNPNKNMAKIRCLKTFCIFRSGTLLTMPTHNPLQSADLCFTTLADNAFGAGKYSTFSGRE